MKAGSMAASKPDTNTVEALAGIIKSSSAPVILFGAGGVGKLALYALRARDIQVSCFCDSSKQKQGKIYCGVKIISPKELSKLSPDTHIFISNNYISSVFPLLRQMNFINIYDCAALLENTDFSAAALDMEPSNVQREIVFHKNACLKASAGADVLNLKCIDIVVTERCSLKCRDCSNLMQYYLRPKHCDLNLLLKSVHRFMKCVNWLHEFRVLGGEPFMNGQLHKIVTELAAFKNAGSVLIYTNGTIIPKGENLACLKNKRVRLDITNYGNLSKKHDELIEILKANNITYITAPVRKWNDCAGIQYHQKTPEELTHMFMNCCMNDVITLLHGKLYRCPFSAHATNLKVVPFNNDEIVDLSDDAASISSLKTRIKRVCDNRQYLSACCYCSGRNYNSAQIDAAVQIKAPLALNFRRSS